MLRGVVALLLLMRGSSIIGGGYRSHASKKDQHDKLYEGTHFSFRSSQAEIAAAGEKLKKLDQEYSNDCLGGQGTQRCMSLRTFTRGGGFSEEDLCYPARAKLADKLAEDIIRKVGSNRPSSRHERVVVKSIQNSGKKMEGIMAGGERLFTITYSTKHQGAGFCYYLASALMYDFNPYILGWKHTWTGMLQKVVHFVGFMNEFGFKDDDIIMFTDSRDVLFRDTPEKVVKIFKDFEKEEKGGVIWQADGGCIPAFCDFKRKHLFPACGGRQKCESASFRYLNSGFWIARASVAKEYFSNLKEPLKKWEERGVGIDQGLIAQTFIDGLLGKFSVRSYIDTAAAFAVSGWYVPLWVWNASTAPVLHFNGGFRVGVQDQSGCGEEISKYEEERPEFHLGLNISRALHRPAFEFAKKVKAEGRDYKIQAATNTGGTWLPFSDLCSVSAKCMPKPQLLDSDLTHKGKC